MKIHKIEKGHRFLREYKKGEYKKRNKKENRNSFFMLYIRIRILLK